MKRDALERRSDEWEEGEQQGSPTSLPPFWPYLIFCAIAALSIVFGTIHRDQHADSILNVLISLQCWTPFVWEQDRFGMLVPLLAWPIREPLANLLAQAFLSTFAGLAAIFLLARWTTRSSGYPLVGTIGAASLLALTPPHYRFEYLVNTSYGIALSIATWALILIEPGPPDARRPRLIASLLLMVLAHWVNSATALFLGPFVVFKGWLSLGWDPSRWPVAILGHEAIPPRDRFEILARGLWRTESVRALVVLAVGYEAGQVMIRLNPYQPTDLSAIPASGWPLAWLELLRGHWLALSPPYWLGPMALGAVVGVIGLARRGRGGPPGVVRPVAALLATAVVLWLLMGTRAWVQMNGYSFRYLIPSALMVQTAVAGLAVSAFRVASPVGPRGRHALAVGVGVVLLMAGTWSYGIPSLAGVRRDIDRNCGALTEDLLASRASCLAGDYWTVWPAVFHANLVLRERGESRTVWGLTFRSQPSYDLWKDEIPGGCLAAVPLGDGQGDVFLRSYLYRSRVRQVEVRRTIQVFRATSP